MLAGQAPVMGFAYTDGLHILHPDRLHIDGRGNLLHALKYIVSELTQAAIADINDQLACLTVPNLPSKGLDALDRGLTSNEVVVLAKAVIVPLIKYLAGPAGALARKHMLLKHTLTHHLSMCECHAAVESSVCSSHLYSIFHECVRPGMFCIEGSSDETVLMQRCNIHSTRASAAEVYNRLVNGEQDHVMSHVMHKLASNLASLPLSNGQTSLSSAGYCEMMVVRDLESHIMPLDLDKLTHAVKRCQSNPGLLCAVLLCAAELIAYVHLHMEAHCKCNALPGMHACLQ